MLVRVTGDAVDGVHRVVAADHEQVADVVLLQAAQDRREVLVLELQPARAERAAGGVAERLERFPRLRAEIDQVAVEHAFDAEPHAEHALDRLAFQRGLDDAGQRGIDDCGRAAGLSDQGVRFEHELGIPVAALRIDASWLDAS
jgi:hypothetical protein